MENTKRQTRPRSTVSQSQKRKFTRAISSESGKRTLLLNEDHKIDKAHVDEANIRSGATHNYNTITSSSPNYSLQHKTTPSMNYNNDYKYTRRREEEEVIDLSRFTNIGDLLDFLDERTAWLIPYSTYNTNQSNN
ncbi:uncharacterized protein LOC115718618 [Cannabis sativa]|uniref:uncharacterized protein LOC115718618 n=1 Tax=Cannabis sativa TaxID=3483 RepID=UPI0029CA2869|nr:uncharacterized protein LOC115718618 [Cannabis sativa]